MTQKEFDRRMAAIMAQEVYLGVKIEIPDLIDKDHLDCVWYGGVVGTITFPNGWKAQIEARGDIRLYGYINGNWVDVADKNNGGNVYNEMGLWYDDADIQRCLDSDVEQDRLEYQYGNWFEVNAVSPDGRVIDLCGADNVLDDCILDCFEHVEDYLEYIGWAQEKAAA